MTAVLAPVRLGEVLHLARMRNASDIHLSAGIPPVLRVDGALESQPTLLANEAEIESLAAALLDEAARAQLLSHGDVTMAYRDEHIGSARVHAYRTSRGTSLAIRLLALSVPSLESLRLPPIIGSFTERSSGLVILTGPTGSGKSTALAAMIDRINRTSARHVITIEDPIEYEHVSDRSVIHQRELGREVDSFAKAVYGALRSDPDVVLIGEMRDPQTMHAALTAAETGHLVLTTLHTGDAPQTVDRIVGVFEAGLQQQIRTQLAQTLIGIACLRLLPRAAGRGRIGALEILVSNDAVRNLVREGKTHQLRNVISTSRQAGMQTLETHLGDLIAGREITLEAARSVTDRADDLRQIDRSAG